MVHSVLMHRWLKAVNNYYKSSISSLVDAGKSSSGLWWPLEPLFIFIYTVFVTAGLRVDRVFSLVVWIWTTQIPHPQKKCPLWFGRGAHSLAGEGVGRPNSDEGTYTVVFYVLCDCRSTSGRGDRMEGEQQDHVWLGGGISWSDGPRGRLALQLTIRRITWCW